MMAETSEKFEHRLDSLEQQGVEQRNRLIHVERNLEVVGANVTTLGGKVDQVITTLTASSAAAAATPRFDIYKVVPFIATIVVLVGAGASAITYIASNIAAAPIERQASAIRETQQRIDFLQQRLDNGWLKIGAGVSIRAPGGTVNAQ